jgi:hypothetical protein
VKFTSFKTLVITGAAVVAVGSCGFCVFASPSDPELVEPVKQTVVSPTNVVIPANVGNDKPVPDETRTADTNGGGEPLRDMDSRILARARQGMSGDKVKDAFKGEAWKVNLYSDSQNGTVERLKLDLNRNEKWEEKWTFEKDGADTKVKRQVAPADDENYSVEYRLLGGKWVRK